MAFSIKFMHHLMIKFVRSFVKITEEFVSSVIFIQTWRLDKIYVHRSFAFEVIHFSHENVITKPQYK
jgi:hypothetical protein